jgi:hypothetical protein
MRQASREAQHYTLREARFLHSLSLNTLPLATLHRLTPRVEQSAGGSGGSKGDPATAGAKRPGAAVPVFCDLDGVLADFDAGVMRVTGRAPSQLEPRYMWPALAKSNNFCEYNAPDV